MQKFDLHTIENTSPESKPLLEAAKANYQFVPNLLAIMAEAPPLLEGYMKLSEIFSKSSLSVVEQQIVLLTASLINECHYCMAAHSVISQMSNIPDHVVEALRNDEEIKDSKLEALKEFTKVVVTTRGWPQDEDINAFIGAGYYKKQILEVILGVGLKTLSNYTNHIAQTPLDDAFQSAEWKKAAELV